MYAPVLKAADKSAAAKKAWLSRAKAKAKTPTTAPAKTAPVPTPAPVKAAAPAPVAPAKPAAPPPAPAKLTRAQAAQAAMAPHIKEMESMLAEMDALRTKMAAVGAKMQSAYNATVKPTKPGKQGAMNLDFPDEYAISVDVQNMKDQYNLGKAMEAARSGLASMKKRMGNLKD